MDIKSFGLGFGSGVGTILGILGIKKLIDKKRAEKNVPETIEQPENDYIPETEEKKEEPGGEEDEELSDEGALYRDLSAPYIHEPIETTASNYAPAESDGAELDICEISEEDFFLAQGAKKRFLTYFDVDGVLADEMDEIVEDPMHLVGGRIFRQFVSSGKPTIHLKNYNESCVIEIGRVNESYTDYHGGGAD